MAVSGGSDSLALLCLFRRWRDARALNLRIVAVTVDHGLRQEAADEARQVGAICAAWGIDHVTKVWLGDKPSTGLAAAARLARYRLLAEAATQAGTDAVLTGHTADDQAETLAMRLARGEGRGSAGMAATTLFEDRVWVIRPLLSMRREALRDVLRGIGQPWIDDPSNERETSERVRVRRALAGKPGEVERLVRAAAEVGEARRAEALAAARWLERAEAAGEGAVRLPRDGFVGDTPPLPLRALLAAIGGASHLPSEDATGALIARLRAGQSGALSRTLVKRRRDGFLLSRERRGKAPVKEMLAAASERGSVAPWATFLPGFDIPLRNAIGCLLGIPIVPETPK